MSDAIIELPLSACGGGRAHYGGKEAKPLHTLSTPSAVGILNGGGFYADEKAKVGRAWISALKYKKNSDYYKDAKAEAKSMSGVDPDPNNGVWLQRQMRSIFKNLGSSRFKNGWPLPSLTNSVDINLYDSENNNLLGCLDAYLGGDDFHVDNYDGLAAKTVYLWSKACDDEKILEDEAKKREEAEAREKSQEIKAAESEESEEKTRGRVGQPTDTKSAEETANQDAGKKVKGAAATVEIDRPNPKVEIYVPNEKWQYGDASMTFSGIPENSAQAALVSYSFDDTTEKIDGAFSFAIANEILSDGTALFDAIKIFSVVKIFEDDENCPSFVGIVHSKRVSASMSKGSVQRKSEFSGRSIMSALGDFELFPNLLFSGAANTKGDFVDSTVRKINAEEGGGWAVRDYVAAAWIFFRDFYRNQNGSMSSTDAISAIVKKFVGECEEGDDGNGGKFKCDFITTGGHDLKMRYACPAPFMNGDTVKFKSVLDYVFSRPLYECFTVFRDNGKVELRLRQTPFSADDWAELPVYQPSLTSVMSYSLEKDDADVYTAFLPTIKNATKSAEFNMKLAQAVFGATGDGGDADARDLEAEAIYGQRILSVDVLSGATGGAADNYEVDETAARETAKQMKQMFAGLHKCFSGTITAAIRWERKDGATLNPKAGCLLKFMGGTFYVKSARHSWTCSRTGTVSMSVCRGVRSFDGGEISELDLTGTMKGEMDGLE